jgi:hypothetical protein
MTVCQYNSFPGNFIYSDQIWNSIYYNKRGWQTHNMYHTWVMRYVCTNLIY